MLAADPWRRDLRYALSLPLPPRGGAVPLATVNEVSVRWFLTFAPQKVLFFLLPSGNPPSNGDYILLSRDCCERNRRNAL